MIIIPFVIIGVLFIISRYKNKERKKQNEIEKKEQT